jgi:hypothetical protein
LDYYQTVVGWLKEDVKKGILDFGHFHDICINAMCGSVEPTIRAPVAVLFTRLALGAAMPIHALRVVTFESKATGSHTGDSRQNEIFILRQFAIMVVMATFIWTFTLQEVKIAEFQFLNSIQFISGYRFEIEPVDTLAVSIPLNGFRCVQG